MNIAGAKNIPLADYLQSIGITPCKKQGNNLWYYSLFRKETEASFKINLVRNQWFDFGIGKGGNMLDFVMEQQGIEDIFHALQILSGKTARISPANSFSFRQQENLSAYEEIRILPLENPLLIQYMGERQINIPFAQQLYKEVHFRFKDKSYFAIGLKNNMEGYELKNKYFQGTLSPKGITTIKQGNDSCCIFEGFMDYLSYLTLKQKHNPENTDIEKQDYIILNSVSNILKAIDIISGYKAKYCYLDSDKAGTSAYEEIRNKCSLNASDRSVHYRGYKDLNDYLVGKKQVQEKRQNWRIKR
ncbi:DNA primase [termite gut metagenome]|uniref:DNA primase n=1 Tax=termite gut metagenome TaxID=433724 RepID=A0A5J4SV11_9ZZZZ